MNEQWKKYYELAYKYYKENGTLFNSRRIIIQGINITSWLREQRSCYINEKLDAEQIELLENIEIDWWYKCTWKDAYTLAQQYYKEHGNLDIDDGYFKSTYLKNWLVKQRYEYNRGNLPSNKIKALKEIGMVWRVNKTFDETYEVAKKYFEEHGNLDVPENELVDGILLRVWLDTQRTLYKKNTLSKEKIDKLESICIAWNINESNWNNMYEVLKRYYSKYKSINIKGRKKFEGYSLGQWLSYQRRLYREGKLSKEQIDKLNKLKISWVTSVTWDDMYSLACDYYEKHDNLLVPRSEKVNNLNLGKWINTQRCAYKKDRLSDEKIKLLEDIGMVWIIKVDKINSMWDYIYRKVYKYYITNGNLDIPDNYVEYGVSLNKWLKEQITLFNRNILSEERSKKLENLGLVRENLVINEDDFDMCYWSAKEYVKKYGNLLVPNYFRFGGINLGRWISKMRKMYKNRTLDIDSIGKLSLINMVWDTEIEENKNKCINELLNNNCNLDNGIEELVNNYGYETLFNFICMFDNNITYEKVNEIIETIQNMYTTDCYNIFILYLLGLDYNSISKIYNLNINQVELIRLKIYKMVLYELKNDFINKDKELVKRIMSL